MRKKIILFFIITLLTAAGSATAQTYHIGDLITHADGSRAIVFYVNPDGSGGWSVALNDSETPCIWGPENDIDMLPNLSSKDSLLKANNTNGYSNTQIIRQLNDPSQYPAAWSVDFENGWYLPSAGQLIHLYSALGLIDSLFSQYGGQTLEGRYWSSTERDFSHVWYVWYIEANSSSNGIDIISYDKKEPTTINHKCKIRAVHDFSCRDIVYDTTLNYVWNTGESSPSILVRPEQTTTFRVTATSGYGCSNHAQQTVIVQKDTDQTLYDTICLGEPYTNNGFFLRAEDLIPIRDSVFTKEVYSGTCQSTIFLHLHVNQTDTVVIDTVLCEHATLSINGHTYTEEGYYTQRFSNQNGCDSILIIHLTYHPDIIITTTPLSSCYLTSQTVTAQFQNLGEENEVQWSFNRTSETHYNIENTDSCSFYIPFKCNEYIPYTIFATDRYCSVTDSNFIFITDTIPPSIEGTLDTLYVMGCLMTDIPNPAQTVVELEQMGVTVSDNCTPSINLFVHSSDQQIGDCPITIARKYTIQDSCFSRSTITQTIVVNRYDSIRFSSVPSSCIVPCIDQVSLDSIVFPTATDYCGNVLALSGQHIEDTDFNGCEGNVSYTWTYTDCEQHQHDWTFTFILERNTVPTLLTSDVDSSAFVECIENAVEPNRIPLALSICGDTLHGTLSDSATTFDGCFGTRTFTYTYTDCAGSTIFWNFTYTIKDTTAPTFTAPENHTVHRNFANEYNASPDITGQPTGLSDNCTPTEFLHTTYRDSVVSTHITETDTLIRTWILTDTCGNETRKTQQIFIIPANRSLVDTTLCEEKLPLRWNGFEFFQNTDTTITLFNAEGIDSILTLQFRILHGTFTSTDDTACEYFDWQDSTLLESGVYPFNYINDNGCASADTLHLVIHHATASSDTTYLCKNTLPTRISGHLIPADIDYEVVFTDTVQNIYSCDSVIFHHFLILDNPHIRATHLPDLCAGDSQLFSIDTTESSNIVLEQSFYGMASFVLSGNYTEHVSDNTFLLSPPMDLSTEHVEEYNLTIFNTAGCALDTTFPVQFRTSQETVFTDTICAGSTYREHGFEVTLGAFAGDTLLQRTEQSAYGCDSTIYVHLNIRPAITITSSPITTCPSFGIATLRVEFANVKPRYTATWYCNNNPPRNIELNMDSSFYREFDIWPVMNLPRQCDTIIPYIITVSNDVCTTTDTNYIILADTVAPTITGTLDTIVTEGCFISDAPTAAYSIQDLERMGVQISDNCCRNYELTITHSDVPVGSCPITVTRTYTVQDFCGNRSTISQILIIHHRDTIKFTSTPLTHQTIHCIADTNPSLIIPPTALDYCGSVLPHPQGPVRSSNYDGCEGDVSYTWTYTDCEGHHRDWTFTYTVERTNEPVVLASGIRNAAFTECLDAAIEPTTIPLALSSCGDTIHGILSNIVTDYDGCRGTRTFTYSYADCADNDIQWDFTYTIEDTTAPSFIVPNSYHVHRDINHQYQAEPDITGRPTALDDNCTPSEFLVLTYRDIAVSNHITETDTLIRKWILTDSCGNETRMTQQIFIHPVNHHVIDTALCLENLPLQWNEHDFYRDTDTTLTLKTAEGIDSILTLSFRVLYGTFNAFTEVDCDNHWWHDSLYLQSGVYTYEYHNAYGCGSTDTLHLTLHYATASSDTTYLCRSDLPKTCDGHLIGTNVDSYITFADTLRTMFHCDSVVTRHYLIIENPSIHIEDHHIDCSDQMVNLSAQSDMDNFLWSTGERTAEVIVPSPGIYHVETANEYGCVASDSIILTWQEHPVTAVNLPDLCSGETYTFHISAEATSQIVLNSNVSTLAVNDTIFLPDGTYCEPNGCSYRSPVTFTDFSPNAHINSVEDIYYLRLNIEHSYCKDIYINLTCPNGQKADILKYGGWSSYNECASLIPEESRGWSGSILGLFGGNNTDGYCDFGKANHNDNSPKCSSQVNPYGTGWNYCWSNNTNQNYGYAPGDGSLIYRSVNTHNGSLDSSHVAERTHFYHPDESFSSLIGCPMNGNWYIEVMDGLSQDNGYIYGWELALAPELHPYNEFSLDTFDIEGPWAAVSGHSTFTITPPITLEHDTVVSYIITLYDEGGCAFDTTISISIQVPRDTLLEAAICAGEIFQEYGFVFPTGTQDTLLTRVTQTTHGCDSTISVQLHILPIYHHYDTLHIPSIQLPTTYRGTTIPAGTVHPVHIDTTFSSVDFCDSVLTTTVYILPNDTTRLDSTICLSEIPLSWNGCTFISDSIVTLSHRLESGIDSIVILTVHVIPNPIDQINLLSSLCAGDSLLVIIGYQFNAGIILKHPQATNNAPQNIFLNGIWSERASDSTFRISSPNGLSTDTLVTYSVTLIDSLGCVFDTTFDIHFYPQAIVTVYDTIVQNELPYPYNGHTFPISTMEDDSMEFHFTTIHGCDSLVHYHLHVFKNDTVEVADTLCTNALFHLWNGKLFTQPGTQSALLRNMHNADSLVVMTLYTHPNDTTYRDTTVCEDALSFEWDGLTFSATGTQSKSLYNLNGCDSTVFYTLNTYALPAVTNIQEETIENELPFSFLDSEFTTDTSHALFHLSDIHGCDSVIDFSLTVHWNSALTLEETHCDYELPITWNGFVLAEEGTVTDSLFDMYDADSLVTFQLNVIHTDVEIISLTEDFCENNSATLEVVTAMTDYVWSTGENSSSIEVTTPGVYTVTASEEHCTAISQFVVETCDFQLLLPNAITPSNHDGLNDEFFIAERYLPQIGDEHFEIVILNRWGEVVFASKDKHFRWNGEFRGVLYNNVIYNYVIHYANATGKELMLKGSITVL